MVPELDADNLRITLVTILVNTKDAFTALNTTDVSDMEVGDTVTSQAPSWDSETEANTETADTIPQPTAAATGGGSADTGYS